MSTNQKRFYAQSVIFGALIIGWVILFIVNKTIFYWQNDTMKMTFYWLCAAAFAALVVMNIISSIIQRRSKEPNDERDKMIFRRASLWAIGTSYTIVVVLLLVISIFNISKGIDTISANLPLFIVIIGGVVLLLTQAAVALISYGRKGSYA